MTIANATTSESFVGDNIQTIFNFTIDVLASEANTIKVYLDGVLQGAGFIVNLTAAVDGIHPGGDVTFVAAPGVAVVVKISRETPKTQTSNFVDGAFPSDSVEKTHDRAAMQIAELQTAVDLVAAPAPVVPADITQILEWAQPVDYVVNDVITESGRLYRCLVLHTSNSFPTDFGNGNWEILTVEGIEGPIGQTGVAGVQGDPGAQGNAGANGADGADGLIVAIASQAEAEAGVENTKAMTALRTKQAIDFQVPNLAVITTLIADLDASELIVQDHANRIAQLENQVANQVGAFSGSQRIQNNAGPIELLGVDAPLADVGRGSRFLRSSVGSEFARVNVYIRRKTTTDFRFTSFVLIMHFIEGDKWYIQREGTALIKESLDFDGVTLTIDTVAGVGQISYSANLMAGADHDLTPGDKANSVIKWHGQEISTSV